MLFPKTSFSDTIRRQRIVELRNAKSIASNPARNRSDGGLSISALGMAVSPLSPTRNTSHRDMRQNAAV
jgi:hypothetical protein